MHLKKTLLPLGSIAAIAAPIAATMSCGFDFGDNYQRKGGEIVFVTDTGSVQDHSFNESSWQAVQDFGQDKNKTYSYISPTTLSTQLFHKTYREAFDNDAQTLVLSGFHHAHFGEGGVGAAGATPDDALTPFVSEQSDIVDGFEKEYPDKHFVGIDIGDARSDNNLYGLNFKSSEASFLAAVYSGIYMNQNNLIEGNSLKFAAYGGLPLATVTSFLDGYLQGAKFFNEHFQDGGAHTDWKPMEPLFADGNKPSIKDFTGGFAPGLATELSAHYLEDGAQIIVSVAGPQTADSVGAILESGKKGRAFVIGPDTDQSLIYDKDVVLGSMAKGIRYAVYSTLNDIYDGDPTTVPGDHDFVLHDQGKTVTDPNKMYVGYLPSIAYVGTSKDSDVRANDVWTKALDIADQERVDAGAEVTRIFDTLYHSNAGVPTHSIDLIARKFTSGHLDGTINKFSDSTKHVGTQNDSYVIVKDMRTDTQINDDLAKVNTEAANYDRMINEGIANSKTLAGGLNAAQAKAAARTALNNKYNKPTPGILFWDAANHKWVKSLPGRQFAGGFYATW